MRFYTKQHKHYCGIDLHSKTMYLCIINSGGEVLLHKNHKCRSDELERALEPYRKDLVICVECMFAWYWIADWCAEQEIPFVLGHALAMKAIHGSKTKSDKLDSHKIALLLKGGLLPEAYAYPARMRATRDLLRRRTRMVRIRAELMAHIKMTADQYNLGPLPVRVKTRGTRDQIAGHFPHPTVRQAAQLDVDMIGHLDDELRGLELSLVQQAKRHDAIAFQLLKTVPGIGDIIALVILYEIDRIDRFPTVQKFASYARLVRGNKESAGKRVGKGSARMGNAHLKWAFSEAAVLFLRGNPEAQQAIQRLASRYGKGKALSILAHKLGRAVYTMMSKKKPFDEVQFMASF